MGFRLTKQHRLLGTAEFGLVFQGAKLKAAAPQLMLLGLATERGHARLGLVISKKNVGNAVARNRIKRLSREVFRQRVVTLPSMDVVVLARPGLALMTNPQFTSLLNQLFMTLDSHYRRRIAPLCADISHTTPNPNNAA